MTQIITQNWGWGWSWSGNVVWPNSSYDDDITVFDWTTWKLIKDSGKGLNEMQDKLTAWTDLEIVTTSSGATTISGTDIISLPNARKWRLNNVILSGKCEQVDIIPDEYQRVDWITWDGTAYINLDTALTNNDEIEIVFSYSTTTNYEQMFWGRTNASTNNIAVAFATAYDNIVLDFNNSDYTPYRLLQSISPNTVYTIKISKNKRAIYQWATLVAENTTVCNDTISVSTWYLFYVSGNPSFTIPFTWTIYSCIIKNKRNLIPVKRKSDNVVWMYDIISKTFFTNASTWSFTAWSDITTYIPTSNNPVDIVCNNWILKADSSNNVYADWTEETVNLHWINIWDNSKLSFSWVGYTVTQTEYWFKATAWASTTNASRVVAYMDMWVLRAWKTYVLGGLWGGYKSLYVWRTVDWTNDTWYYKNGGAWRSFTITDIAEGQTRFIISIYLWKADQWTVYDFSQIQLEMWTVSSDYEIPYDWGDATAEMLLSCGEYADEQDVLSWTTTHNIKAVVVTWNENWDKYRANNGYSMFRFIAWFWEKAIERAGICTHFEYYTIASSNIAREWCTIWGNLLTFYIAMKWEDMTLEDFKSRLDGQNRKWEPVIFIYPLDTPWEETATPQSLDLKMWGNVIEVTESSLSGLWLSANYERMATNVINFVNNDGFITDDDIPEYTAWTWISIEDYVISATGGWGNGDVTWPNSATNWNLAVFDWTTGKLIKDWWTVPVVPTIVDNLTTQSATSTLSANQGYVLKWLIDNLMAQWRFLSLWNCATGMPISFPLATPYTYITWDYFMVEVVDSDTNYRPTGSSYNGTASSTAETWEVEVWDYYVYDWTVWLLASNHWKEVSFSNLAWQPSDNANLSTALNSKQNNWIEVNVTTAYDTAAKVWTTTAWNYTPAKWDFILVNFVNGCSVNSPTLNIDGSGAKQIRTGASQPWSWVFGLWNTENSNIKALFYYDWEYYRCWSTTNTNTTYSAMSVNEWKTGTATSARTMRADYLKQIIKYHSVSDTAYASSWDWATDIAPSKNAVYNKIESLDLPIISDTAPTTPTQWMIWYDTTNDKLKTYNWSSWDEAWSGTDTSNTKTFYISSTSDLTNAQAAYDWYVAGKNPIIQHTYSWNTYPYTYILEDNWTSTKLRFKSTHLNKVDAVSSSYTNQFYIEFTISSGNVTTITTWTMEASPYYLSTSKNYGTPYTPLYDGSPATKKYVDDNDTVKSWDSWTTYTIKVSNSAPASWTPNTTITFRTN